MKEINLKNYIKKENDIDTTCDHGYHECNICDKIKTRLVSEFISVGELRSLGIKIYDKIPDCGYVAKNCLPQTPPNLFGELLYAEFIDSIRIEKLKCYAFWKIQIDPIKYESLVKNGWIRPWGAAPVKNPITES